MSLLALVLLGAALASGLAHHFKVAGPPVLVLLGLLLRTSGLVDETEILRGLLILGVTVLVFSAGAELNPRRLSRYLVPALKIGLSQFFLLGSLGATLAWSLGRSPFEAACIALSVCGSSTFVVVRYLRGRAQFYENFGRLVLGVLLVQDSLVILGVAILTSWQGGLVAVESALFRSLLLMGAAWLCSTTLVAWALERFHLDEEAQLISVMGLLFAFLGLAHFCQLPLPVGAFAAGLAVSTFPANVVVRGQLNSLSGFFVAVFFLTMGALAELPKWKDLMLVPLLLGAILLVTPLLATVFSRKTELSARASLQTGLLLANSSEFALLVALLGLQQSQLDRSLVGAITLVALISMLWLPWLASEGMVWRILEWLPGPQKDTPPSPEESPQVVVLGCGRSGEDFLRSLQQRVSLVVIEHDPQVYEWAREQGFQVLLGDASQAEVLEQAGVRRARVVVSNLPRLADNVRVLNLLEGRPMLVRTFTAEESLQVEKAGGIPVSYSEAALEEFLQSELCPRGER